MKITAILFLVVYINLNMQLSCMEESSLDDNCNPFELGLNHLLEDIQGNSEERIRLLQPGTATRINVYVQSQKVSKDTKQLITRFLSLPKELQEHIVTFLDGPPLAYFVHLKCVSKKTHKKAYKKITRSHILSMINRLQKKSDNQTLCNLFDEAIHAGTQSKNPFSDLRRLRAHLNHWIIKPKVFKQLLNEYVDNTQIYTSDDRYHQLRKKFLKVLSITIDKRIKRYNQCGQYLLLSRYCTSGELCCLSALLIVNGCLISSTIPYILSCISCVACGAYTCSCCVPNILCNCPEKAIVHTCAQGCKTAFLNNEVERVPGAHIFCSPCSFTACITEPSIHSCNRYLDFSRMTNLHKVKKFITTTMQAI